MLRITAYAVVGGTLFASMSASAFWEWGPFGMLPGGWGDPWNAPCFGTPYAGYGYPLGVGSPYRWGAPLHALPVYGYPSTVYPPDPVAPADPLVEPENTED